MLEFSPSPHLLHRENAARTSPRHLDRPCAKSTSPWGAVLHNVHGTFEVKEGMLRLDVASGKICGRIVVDVKSGNTGDDERDRRMHRDVLESAGSRRRFPRRTVSPGSGSKRDKSMCHFGEVFYVKRTKILFTLLQLIENPVEKFGLIHGAHIIPCRVDGASCLKSPRLNV
jgi:hypothetical protein